jgi:aminoglycoside 3-N-acetyltransferase
MKSSVYTSVRSILEALRIARGDLVLLHSDMSYLIQLSAPQERQSQDDLRDYLLNCFHSALTDTVGPDGTICVLGSFTDYARFGTPFVLEEALPDKSLGAYCRYLFRQPGIRRSLNPIVGIIAKGRHASWICEHKSANGYGPESPWAKMLELDGKMIFWGVGLGFMTFVHHAEQLCGVPHTYNKLYATPVYHRGKKIELPVVTNVRYLKFNVVYNLSRLERELMSTGKVVSHTRDGFQAHMVRFKDAMDHLTNALVRDPHYLLDQPPEFVAGEIPTDGAAGPLNPNLARRS